ncbi:MAG: hypothetical protein CVU95_04090 [Firmicutes bacterium HGW-Firmicutes-2]|nr:MAG: hypothetical protein CVU95_04090 [Firmicutes bacterium HGW-Firmicutes-2]
MRFLMNMALCMLIFTILYSLISAFVIIPNRKASKYIHRAKIKKEKTVHIMDVLLMPMVKVIRLLVYMSPDKTREMAYRLKKVGIDEDPRTYEAICITKSLLIFASGIVFYILGIKISMIGVLGLAPIYYIQKKDYINKKMQSKEKQISWELPYFARYFISNIKSGKDVIKTLKIYYEKRTASALRYDLELTLSEMTTADVVSDESSRVKALENMDIRISIPEMSDLIRGIIAVEKGIDQTSYFDIVEKNMKELALANLEKKLKKYPKRVNFVSMVVAVSSLIIIFIPFIMFLMNSNI